MPGRAVVEEDEVPVSGGADAVARVEELEDRLGVEEVDGLAVDFCWVLGWPRVGETVNQGTHVDWSALELPTSQLLSSAQFPIGYCDV